MQKSLTVLDTLTIPTDCRVSWDRMRGDDRIRFCSVCNQNVHNLLSMSSSEATALLTSNVYNVCVRFYRRPDGTVVTRDCEEIHSSRKRQLWHHAVAALAACLGITFVSGCFQSCQGAPARPMEEGQAKAQMENKRGAAEPGAAADRGNGDGLPGR